MSLFFWAVIFIISLYFLSKTSDYFTDSAEELGLFLGLSPFIVGVTIVALGTSLPELIASLFSVFRGSSEIVIGNVVGSNITNIFLILAVAVIVGKKMKIAHELINVDLPLFIGSTFLLILMIWDGTFTPFEGILSLFAFAVYILYVIRIGKKRNAYEELKEEEMNLRRNVKRRGKKIEMKTIVILFLSILAIFVSAHFTIESILRLSNMLNIGKEIIAASVVALGTSLPELAVSVKAARRGKAEIAIGNVLGSNIFNSLVVMGIPSLFGTLIIPQGIIFFGVPVLLVATFLYFFAAQDRQITQWEGWMLIVFYIFYLGKLFNLI